jgi:hypothetical protein
VDTAIEGECTDWPAAALPKAWREEGSKGFLGMLKVCGGSIGAQKSLWAGLDAFVPVGGRDGPDVVGGGLKRRA